MSERTSAEEELQSQKNLSRDDTPESADDETRGGGIGLDRRQYLKLGAATAVGAVAFSGRSTAETRDGVSFDRVVDAVDDLGMDPNGNEPIDDKLDSAWGSGTLIEFPAGEYLVTSTRNYYHDTNNAGIVGKTGDRSDVEFVFPDGFNDRFLNVRYGSDLLFGDFTIQQSDDWETGVGCSFAPDGDATIRNIEIAGNNPRGKQRGLALTVYNSNGVMNLDGYVRTGAGAVGDYPSGTQAIFVNKKNNGTIYIRDAHVENAGENGIYASRSPGDVRIEGGHFANNDIASVRIAGDGSYVEGATFVIDTDNADYRGSYDNVRGLWVESGGNGYVGGRVENCDFILRSASNSGGLLRVQETAGDVEINNCRFHNETRFATLFAKEPDRISGSGPVKVRNCSFTGSGSSDPRRAAIELLERDGSLVSDCCISMDGSQRGVVVRRASSCTIRRSTIDVNSKAIYTPGSSVATSGISHSGSCPLPSDGGDGAGGDVGGSRGDSSDDSSSDEGSDSDESSDDSSSDDSSSDESSNGDDSSSSEESDDSESSSDSSSGSDESSGDESSDDSEESSSSSDESSSSEESSGGSEESSDDSEESSGGSDESSGSSDGGDSDAETRSPSPSPSDARTLKLASDDVSQYEFSVSGNVDFYPAFGTEDRIDGSTVRGVLAGGTDSYRFDGDISSFTIEGSPTIELDGETVDPSALGGSTEASEESMSNVLVLKSDEHAPYDIEVSGDIALDPRYGTEDSTSGNAATGLLAGGGDAYRFSGDITKFEVDGQVDVTLNGESVDPAELAD